MTRADTSATCLLAALLSITACAPRGAPPQPPTNDTQPPMTEPGSGDVMGADRVSPAQKLEEGPKLGQDGLKPAERPTD
jgi:hypothetical protein